MTAKNNYPRPLYAVAGAGDLAVEQLRKLPAVAEKLRQKVQNEWSKVDLAQVRGRVEAEVTELPNRVRSEMAQLRVKIADVRKKGISQMRINGFGATAQVAVNDIVEAAQQQLKVATRQLTEVYLDLAQRGEKAFGGNGAAPVATPAGRSTPETAAKVNTAGVARASTTAAPVKPAKPVAKKATKATKATTTRVTRAKGETSSSNGSSHS